MSNFDDLRELSAEAREALRAWGPPTPEHDNPLYYPLLFLCEKIDAALRHVVREAFDASAEENRLAAQFFAAALAAASSAPTACAECARLREALDEALWDKALIDAIDDNPSVWYSVRPGGAAPRAPSTQREE